MKTARNYFFHTGALMCALSTTLLGCVASTAGGAPASATPASAAASPNAVRVVGMLTLKGPAEVGSWLALTDASGVVWRLDTTGPAQFAELRQLQNRRVEVDGAYSGTYLSNPKLRVDKVRPKTD
jgi:Flp pilus assembly protein CpaB